MEMILAINAGSSSLKFQLLKMPSEDVVTEGIVERIGSNEATFTTKFNGNKDVETTAILDHAVAVNMLLDKLVSKGIVKSLEEITGIGHRVVHGGENFSDSVLVTDDVIKAIEAVSDLAPLHNPANLTGIKAFKKALPNVPAVAVFDTAFHQTMKADAYMYPTPYEWYEKYGVRKYGFHGTSHKFVSERAYELIGKKNGNVIVCHIGNGASLSAVKNGKCVETSMGLTPLAGIPMGTRSGDIDPAIVDFVAQKEGKSSTDITNDLNKKSGYLGVSQVSNDCRDIEDAAKGGNTKAMLALDLQCKRIVDHIAAYYVYMGGADAICFTAGIGENSSMIRKKVVTRLAALGIKLDEAANNTRSEEKLISTPDSRVKVYIIPTNEEVVIARDTMRLK